MDKQVTEVLLGLQKQGFIFHLCGRKAFLNLLDQTMLTTFMEVYDTDGVYRQVLYPKTYCIALTQIQDGSTAAQKTGDSYTLFVSSLQQHLSLTSVERKSSEKKHSRVTKLIPTSNKVGASSSGDRHLCIYVIDAQPGTSLYHLPCISDTYYGEDGLIYAGFCGNLTKLTRKLSSGKLAQAKTSYIHLLLIVNFARHGFLNPLYYARLKELADVGTEEAFKFLLDWKEAIYLKLSKELNIMYPSLDFVLRVQRTVTYPLVEGVRDMSNKVIEEKVAITYRESPFRCPHLAKDILQRTLKEADIDLKLPLPSE